LDGVLGDVMLRPTASARAYFVYPTFLGVGMVTLVAGFVLVAFTFVPDLAMKHAPRSTRLLPINPAAPVSRLLALPVPITYGAQAKKIAP
jgi:hypothetical protein